MQEKEFEKDNRQDIQIPSQRPPQRSPKKAVFKKRMKGAVSFHPPSITATIQRTLC